MKLQLNRSLKQRLVQLFTGVLLDVIDGNVDDVGHTIALLRAVADELEQQNPG